MCKNQIWKHKIKFTFWPFFKFQFYCLVDFCSSMIDDESNSLSELNGHSVHRPSCRDVMMHCVVVAYYTEWNIIKASSTSKCINTCMYNLIFPSSYTAPAIANNMSVLMHSSFSKQCHVTLKDHTHMHVQCRPEAIHIDNKVVLCVWSMALLSTAPVCQCIKVAKWGLAFVQPRNC